MERLGIGAFNPKLCKVEALSVYVRSQGSGFEIFSVARQSE